jgi:hypothetical protein
MQNRIANNRLFAGKRLAVSAGVILLCGGALVGAAPRCEAAGIAVTINGSPVDFDGMGPVMINGRVLVPVRGVLESIGADVGWNEATQTVVANNGRADIELRIGDHSASVDGQSVPLDVPAQVIAGHTMVPLRFLSQALGAEVHWNDNARIVAIITNRKDIPLRAHRTDRMRRNGQDRRDDNNNDNSDRRLDRDRDSGDGR